MHKTQAGNEYLAFVWQRVIAYFIAINLGWLVTGGNSMAYGFQITETPFGKIALFFVGLAAHRMLKSVSGHKARRKFR